MSLLVKSEKKNNYMGFRLIKDSKNSRLQRWEIDTSCEICALLNPASSKAFKSPAQAWPSAGSAQVAFVSKF